MLRARSASMQRQSDSQNFYRDTTSNCVVNIQVRVNQAFLSFLILLIYFFKDTLLVGHIHKHTHTHVLTLCRNESE